MPDPTDRPVTPAGENSLSANPSAEDVRQRFDVLMDRLDEFYDHGMWDAQVVAWFLVQEVRRATPPAVPTAEPPLEMDILRALCGEAAQCTVEVDNDAARELTVRFNQAWRGEDPVGESAPALTDSPESPNA